MVTERLNIILITIDSLRADHLSCYGYGRPTSPNIDALARDATIFSRAFSSGPNTPHAFPSIMASREALASRRLGLFDAPSTLAEILQTSGYTTIGFNAGNPYVSRHFQYDRGFERFKDYVDLPAGQLQASPALDNDRFSASAAFEKPVSATLAVPKLDLRHYVLSEENSHEKARLEAGMNGEIFDALVEIDRDRFFLWIHYMDCHYPYLPQAASQQQLGLQPITKEDNLQLNRTVRENIPASPQNLRRIQNLYDAAIRQTDTKVGEILSFLKRQGWYDSSLIVLTSDHGEEFMEHGDLQHKSKLFDELLHVPLIVKHADASGSQRRDELVSLLQLAPTLLQCAGLKHPLGRAGLVEMNANRETTVPGVYSAASYGPNGHAPVDHNLFNIDPLPKIYCYRDVQWKLIMDRGRGQSCLFNLMSDPDEEHNVSDRHPDKVQLFQELLTQIRSLERSRIRYQIQCARRRLTNLPQENHALRPSL